MGVMTKYLLDNPAIETWVVEIDDESVSYLKAHYNTLSARILEEDFLRWNPSKTFGEEKFALVGNFPYNISSQIVFKVLDHMDQDSAFWRDVPKGSSAALMLATREIKPTVSFQCFVKPITI